MIDCWPVLFQFVHNMTQHERVKPRNVELWSSITHEPNGLLKLGRVRFQQGVAMHPKDLGLQELGHGMAIAKSLDFKVKKPFCYHDVGERGFPFESLGQIEDSQTTDCHNPSIDIRYRVPYFLALASFITNPRRPGGLSNLCTAVSCSKFEKYE